MDEQSNNTETFTVSIPHTVTLPLAPIVEAVKAALPQQAATLTHDDIENVLDEKFEDCLNETFDISNYHDDINDVIDNYLSSNNSIDNIVTSVIETYSILDKDDVGNLVTSIIEDDYSFLTEDDVTALIEVSLSPSDDSIERLEARVGQLEYALRKMAEALTAVTTQE